MKVIKQSIALLLCLALVLGTVFAAVPGAGETVDLETTQIAANTFYTTHQLLQNGKDKQQAFYVKYTPGSGIMPVAAYGNRLYGRSTITNIAKYLETNGNFVMAGINADFFSFETGLPFGPVVISRALKSSDAGYNAIAFSDTGAAYIGKPGYKITLTTNTGDVNVDHYNKLPSKWGLYLLSEDFGDGTKAKAMGTDIIFEILGSEGRDVRVNQTKWLKIVDITRSDFSVKIPENHLILRADDLVGADLSKFVLGENVTLNVTTQNYEFADAAQVIGAGEILIKEGQIQPQANSEVHPRSALGIKQNGEVILYEIDGRQSGYSKGLTLTDLAHELASLGCVDAVNLDGGGSSALIMRPLGSKELVVPTKPSDGSLRTCANYLMLVNTLPRISDPIKIHIQPNNPVVFINSDLQLSHILTDANYYPVDGNHSVDYQVLANELGGAITPAGLFSAPGAPGNVLVEAWSGIGYGSKIVKVVDTLGSLAAYSSNGQISEIKLAPGESIDVNMRGYLNGKEIGLSDRACTFTTDANYATVTAAGVLSALGNSDQTKTKLTVSAGGQTLEIPVTISKMGAPVIQMSTADIQGDTFKLEATVTDSSGKPLEKSRVAVSLDGKAVDFEYNTSTGTATINGANYGGGLHRLTVSAEDNFGNRARKSANINSSAALTGSFADIGTTWAKDYIIFAANKGLVQGQTAGGKSYFYPDRGLTRAEFAAIICRFLNINPDDYATTPLTFADNDKIPQWAQNYVKAAYDKKLITGRAAGNKVTFDANATISRAEMITIMGRTFGTGYQPPATNFTDKASIGDWAAPHINLLYGFGIISGYPDGTIKPNAPVTRAEMSKIMFGAY